ncbi:MAG: hypothetical protein JNK55_21905 [Rubrivivax sp.]|nr:hypothetical protein [Rubrivivax sp.]
MITEVRVATVCPRAATPQRPRSHGASAALAAMLLAVAGCASTSVNLSGRDSCNMPLDAAMSRIEVLRPWAFGAGGAALFIFDDDQIIGKLENSSRLCWDRHPGTAYLEYHVAFPDSAFARSVEFPVTAGGKTVIEVTPGDGWRWPPAAKPLRP